ncbi:MAG: hypothetical protein AAGB24_06460 [Bacteroidota bacterium]
MKYKKYISTAFLAIMLWPSLNAKKVETAVEEFDLETVVFIEDEQVIELGFDSKTYLPDGFNAYEGKFSLKAINYVENDTVELGFDTQMYLPEAFDPYKK